MAVPAGRFACFPVIGKFYKARSFNQQPLVAGARVPGTGPGTGTTTEPNTQKLPPLMLFPFNKGTYDKTIHTHSWDSYTFKKTHFLLSISIFLSWLLLFSMLLFVPSFAN